MTKKYTISTEHVGLVPICGEGDVVDLWSPIRQEREEMKSHAKNRSNTNPAAISDSDHKKKKKKPVMPPKGPKAKGY